MMGKTWLVILIHILQWYLSHTLQFRDFPSQVFHDTGGYELNITGSDWIILGPQWMVGFSKVSRICGPVNRRPQSPKRSSLECKMATTTVFWWFREAEEVRNSVRNMTLCCLWCFASMNAHESCWIIIPSSGMISPSPSLESPVMVSITAVNLNQALCNFWCLHLQFFHCANPHLHSEFSHPNRSQYLNDQSMTNQWPMPVQQFISCWSHVHSFWLRSSTIFGASIILGVTRWPLVTSGDLSKNMVRLALPQWWPGFPRISQLATLDTGYEITQGDSDFNYNVYI